MYRSPYARPRQVSVKAQQAHLTTFSPTASVNHLHSGGLKSEKIMTAPKIMSSVNNRWHPYHFYKNNLIAGGESVDSTTMEKQAQKIGRNVKETDVGFWIDLATEAKKENNSLLEKMAAGMSFHCLQQNRLIRLQSKQNSEEKKNESEVLQQRGFFLDDASAQDETITLPNGKQFKITDIITVDDTSNWTSTKFDAHIRLLALKVFDVVAEFDTEFFAYSGKPKPLNYIYVGHDFFRIFAKTILSGFGQPLSNNLSSRVIGNVRSVFSNKLTRVRIKLDEQYGAKWCEKKAKELMADFDAHSRPRENLFGESMRECQPLMSEPITCDQTQCKPMSSPRQMYDYDDFEEED